jgi:hypothetical protein
MTDRPRFTLQFTLRDREGFEPPLSIAIGCDQALRISARAVDEAKMGVYGGFDAVAELVRTKEMRRKLFMQVAEQLVGQMADHMEDAEGWHDPERVDPARKALGGRWEL